MGINEISRKLTDGGIYACCGFAILLQALATGLCLSDIHINPCFLCSYTVQLSYYSIQIHTTTTTTKKH